MSTPEEIRKRHKDTLSEIPYLPDPKSGRMVQILSERSVDAQLESSSLRRALFELLKRNLEIPRHLLLRVLTLLKLSFDDVKYITDEYGINMHYFQFLQYKASGYTPPKPQVEEIDDDE